VFVAFFIFLLGATATSAALGVLLGFVSTLLVAVWATRDSWNRAGAPFHWSPFLTKAFFLTAGLGSGSVLMTLDSLQIKHSFSEDDAGLYAAAGLVGRVLIPLSGSLLSVMFPKIVKSKILQEKSHALAITLGLTVCAATGATLFLYCFPELPIRVVYGSKYLMAVPLVPSYCLCQIPLTVAVVLLYNLMGREHYASVPFLVLVAFGYHMALNRMHDSMQQVIWVMGAAGLAYLAVTVFFTWGWKDGKAAVASPGPGPQDPGPAR
jgi:O-antigen/teichoic acid export membrane protein